MTFLEDIDDTDLVWLQRLDKLLARHAGMTCLPDRRWLLESRVRRRMTELNHSTIESYARQLVAGSPRAQELSVLVERVRVGETGWFRHPKQLRDIGVWLSSFRDPRPEGMFRAWCAGCATGEEVFSLAMILDAALPHSRFCLLGTDISESSLQMAQTSSYPFDQKDSIPLIYRERYFDTLADRLSVRKELVDCCSFKRHNLMEPAYPGAFDLILCRNVLIYFERAARKHVLELMEGALVEGGALVLGYSESLGVHPCSLTPIRVQETVFWVKKSRTATAGPVLEHSAPPVRNTQRSEERSTESRLQKEPVEPGIIRLNGVFSFEDLDRLEKELSRAMEPGHPDRVILDLECVDFLCDEASASFLRFFEYLLAEGRRLALVASRPGVLHWLGRNGLFSRLEIVSSISKARDCLSETRAPRSAG